MIECVFCKRDIPDQYTMKHHLTPRSRKGKITVVCCCPCGSQVHKLFTLKEMEQKFHTVEEILSDERMQKWVRWIRKTNHYKVCMKAKKRR